MHHRDAAEDRRVIALSQNVVWREQRRPVGEKCPPSRLQSTEGAVPLSEVPRRSHVRFPVPPELNKITTLPKVLERFRESRLSGGIVLELLCTCFLRLPLHSPRLQSMARL